MQQATTRLLFFLRDAVPAPCQGSHSLGTRYRKRMYMRFQMGVKGNHSPCGSLRVKPSKRKEKKEWTKESRL